MNGDKSPEYQAISHSRQSLEKQLAPHFCAIAENLRDNNLLTLDQYDEIKATKEDPRQLVDAILLIIEEDPVHLFWKVIELMKACGKKRFRTFIENTVETKRKDLYRDLLAKFGCDHDDEAMKCDVFICYGQKRGTTKFIERVLDLIAKHLHEKGLKVFVDRSTPSPVSLWSPETVGAIRKCRVFVAILTKQFVRSKICHGNLYEAMAHNKQFHSVVLEGDWKSEDGASHIEDILLKSQYWTSITTERELDQNLPNLIDDITANLWEAHPRELGTNNDAGSGPLERQQCETEETVFSGARSRKRLLDTDETLTSQKRYRKMGEPPLLDTGTEEASPKQLGRNDARFEGAGPKQHVETKFDKKVEIHDLPQPKNYFPGVTFHDKPQTKTFFSNGGCFQLDNGVTVEIPNNAVSQGSTLVVKVQPCFAQSDVFMMPKGIEPASPSYLISCDHTTDINNGITVTIEHHVRVSTQEEADTLVFLQADPIPDNKGIYKYREVCSKDRSKFTPKNNKVKYTTRFWSGWLCRIGIRIKEWFKSTKLQSPHQYTVRVYWLTEKKLYIIISLFHKLYFKMLEKHQTFFMVDSADRRSYEEPLCMKGNEIEIKVTCIPDCTCVLEKQKINKVALLYPITDNLKPESLPDTYPPCIECQLSPGKKAESTTTCTVEINGFDRQVSFTKSLQASSFTENHGCATGIKVDDIKKILQMLNGVSVKWYELGLVLDVKKDNLEKIKYKEPKDSEKCLDAMIAERLHSSSSIGVLTWKVICNALRNTLVNRADVAEAIERAIANGDL